MPQVRVSGRPPPAENAGPPTQWLRQYSMTDKAPYAVTARLKQRGQKGKLHPHFVHFASQELLASVTVIGDLTVTVTVTAVALTLQP